MKTLAFQVSDDLFIQLKRAVAQLEDGTVDRVPLRALCAGMLADTLAHRTTKQLRTLAAGQSLPLGRPPVAETEGAKPVLSFREQALLNTEKLKAQVRARLAERNSKRRAK